MIIMGLLLLGIAGCKDDSASDSSMVTISITIPTTSTQSNSTINLKALGTLDDVTKVNVIVKNGANIVANQDIYKTEGLFSGSISNLEKGVELTFIAKALNYEETVLFSNETLNYTQTLVEGSNSISLSLYSIDDGVSVDLPLVNVKVEQVGTIARGESSPIRFWLSSGKEEVLDYEISGSGFSFTPGSGSMSLNSSQSFFISSATASTLYGAGTYDLALKFINSQNNYVETIFNIEIENLYRLPDTGYSGDITTNPISYTDNGNSTVLDNTTKLTWQQQDDASLREQSDAVNYCNSLSLGGQDDWRLPTVKELKDIIHYSNSPAIDSLFSVSSTSITLTWLFFFTETIDIDEYWTSTPSPNGSDYNMVINFKNGEIEIPPSLSEVEQGSGNTRKHFTRCTRGLPAISNNFKDNGDSTVTDQDTRLVWQKAQGEDLNWSSANSYCSSPWRLPNVRELQSLLNNTILDENTVKLNLTYFPNASAQGYWASTVDTGSGSNAWQVNFDTSEAKTISKTTSTLNVRCVKPLL